MKSIDIIEIWRGLHDNDVKYVTVGGFAVNFYGYSRNTGDIDILIEDSSDNRKKLRKALKDIGLGDFPQIETTQLIPGWTDFSIGPGLRLDVMTSIKGLEKDDFKDLYDSSELTSIKNTPVRFIDYKNLILNKKATDRPKDQIDIEELEKIRKLESGEDQNFK
ncbi:MAG: hypothetical protein JWO03_357 [Bacteroidetes bacterium]|nr:hypothetical protein [Bacteroidota bacterium]